MKSLDYSCNDIDPNYKNEIQKPGCSVSDEIYVKSLSFSKNNAPEQFNRLKENLNAEIQEQYNHLFANQLVSKDSIEIKNLKNVCNDNDHSYERETCNIVFPNDVQKYETEIISSLSSNTEDSYV